MGSNPPVRCRNCLWCKLSVPKRQTHGRLDTVPLQGCLWTAPSEFKGNLWNSLQQSTVPDCLLRSRPANIRSLRLFYVAIRVLRQQKPFAHEAVDRTTDGRGVVRVSWVPLFERGSGVLRLLTLGFRLCQRDYRTGQAADCSLSEATPAQVPSKIRCCRRRNGRKADCRYGVTIRVHLGN
jgi:hypothetical protein